MESRSSCPRAQRLPWPSCFPALRAAPPLPESRARLSAAWAHASNAASPSTGSPTSAVARSFANRKWKSHPMTSAANQHFDIAVVGAGPAGIAAAVRAADSGASVALLDDNPHAGGQIWRGGPGASPKSQELKWLDRLEKSSAKVFRGARVFHLQHDSLAAEFGDELLSIAFDKLILATGARELFLPFPGWTLPNVFGAGGLQALVKSGLPVKSKRTVVAGTGPLLLAVAAYLSERGADVLCICEQASISQLRAFALALASFPRQLV